MSLFQVNETEYTSLMYEVLADQTMWAVLGRTAGKESYLTQVVNDHCRSEYIYLMLLGSYTHRVANISH